MKKILFIAICCLMLCGCENWKKDFQTSDIKIEVVNSWNSSNTYITYTIKNISDYTCNAMNATIEFKSGTISTEETVYPSIISMPLKPNQTLTDKYVIRDKNYEGYTATFKKIDCYDKDTN